MASLRSFVRKILYVIISKRRKRFALRFFQEHPEISAAMKEKILRQQVVEGMTPTEAQLAGGQFIYQMQADRKVWPAGTVPLAIMAAQTLHPDDSKISMSFQNYTQFPEEGLKSFRVDFIKGRAVSVTKL